MGKRNEDCITIYCTGRRVYTLLLGGDSISETSIRAGPITRPQRTKLHILFTCISYLYYPYCQVNIQDFTRWGREDSYCEGNA